MDKFYVRLPDRGLIRIEGEDRHAFLQNLLTNDIGLLKTAPSLYACLLTPQGKFLHDMIVREGNGVLFLDCEGGARAQDLYSRLNRYRLRAKVRISVEDTHPVCALFGDGNPAAPPDPRHRDMGRRSFEKPEGLREEPFAAWDTRRIALCIPDGSRDMEPEKTTLAECGIDRLHGVSYKKGCYVGQELTARMHHRGLAKKHLYIVEAAPGRTLPAPGADIADTHGAPVGIMRSSCGDRGLALLRDESLDSLPAQELTAAPLPGQSIPQKNA